MAKIEAIEIKPCPICGYPGIDGMMQKLPISTLFWRDSESEWGAAVNLGLQSYEHLLLLHRLR